jgi:hypothetical protein
MKTHLLAPTLLAAVMAGSTPVQAGGPAAVDTLELSRLAPFATGLRSTLGGANIAEHAIGRFKR